MLDCRDGTLVRVLVFYQCDPGSIPSVRFGVICVLSLLLVRVLSLGILLQVLWFSSLHKNQQFKIPIRPSLRSRRLKNIGSAKYARERETRVGGTFTIACLPPSRSSLFFSRHIDFSRACHAG